MLTRIDKWTLLASGQGSLSRLLEKHKSNRNQINNKSNHTHQQEKNSNSIEKWSKYQ